MEGDTDGQRPVRVGLAPAADFYSRESDAWRGELASLTTELRRDLPEALQHDADTDHKGDPITMVVLSIISSHALTALVGCLKVWLQQHPERDRAVEIDIDDGSGHPKHVVIRARNVDDRSLRAAVEAALKARH